MTVYVIQKFNHKRGRWEDDAESFAKQEAMLMLWDAKSETQDARMITRSV